VLSQDASQSTGKAASVFVSFDWFDLRKAATVESIMRSPSLETIVRVLSASSKKELAAGAFQNITLEVTELR
jgi:hypothetical protein